MDIGTFRGIVTAILLIAFLGLIAWAWSKRRKADFAEAAQLPFADDEPIAAPPLSDQASETRQGANSQETDFHKNAGASNT